MDAAAHEITSVSWDESATLELPSESTESMKLGLLVEGAFYTGRSMIEFFKVYIARKLT
jgi:hypothetical protein